MIAVFVGTFRHGSSPLAAGLSLLFFFFVLLAKVVDASELEIIIGLSVRDCLRRANITEEQAADLMGMKLSALRKCLRGEGRLQLGVARLLRLGLLFWTYLTPMLLYHAARLYAEQVRDDAVDAAKTLMGRRA